MKQIKSALGLGLRPSAHILRLKKPRSGWSELDHTCAEAFQTLEDERCPECGYAVWLCRSRDNMLDFKAKWDTCNASAKKEQATKAKKKQRPGEFVYVVPEMMGDKPLPTREAYYESLQEEQDVRDKGKRGLTG